MSYGRCKAVLFHEDGSVDRCQSMVMDPHTDDLCYLHKKYEQGLTGPCNDGEGAKGEARTYRMEVMGTNRSVSFR